MPASVENGLRDGDEVNRIWTSDVEKHDMSPERDNGLGTAHFAAQDMDLRLNTHLAVQSALQIPTPSPTPSPRSTSPSPSLVVTDTSSAEWSGNTSSAFVGQNHSRSFEKATVSSGSEENGEGVVMSPLPISKTLPPHELHDIPEERVREPRKPLASKTPNGEKVPRLVATEGEGLTSEPSSLHMLSPRRLSFSGQVSLAASPTMTKKTSISGSSPHRESDEQKREEQPRKSGPKEPLGINTNVSLRASSDHLPSGVSKRPGYSSRAISTPPASSNRMSSYSKALPSQTSPKRKSTVSGGRPDHLDLNSAKLSANDGHKPAGNELPSPIPTSIPLPPMSIPTYLQLELSSTSPSSLYIYRSAASEYPYESSKIKFERLLNFLLLPPQLEQVLYFGSLACLDAWLYTFTILPLRFFKALGILIQWWGQLLTKEVRSIGSFIYHGSGRMWNRQRTGSVDPPRSRSVSRAGRPPISTTPSSQTQPGRIPESLSANTNFGNLKADVERKSRPGWRRHRRVKSEPSSLTTNDKADIIQGALIICSCMILLKLDASRMYHSIRGQSNVKLYVIYNLLEVCDRLLSAFGQDTLECLLSDETLERDRYGRSRILRPLGMFVLALIYNVIHATALLYHVITLNVAVNSYSNALLTLLMSNQFVEIKGTVFKKFEKDNLFQLTCADVVERFQLWLMLMIIALRNIVEMGGLSLPDGAGGGDFTNETIPIRGNSILPNSFTILPSWSGEVLTPFLLVLGSEMLVDWIKHAYISKFNGVKPAIYQRFLDVLAKDYYTNAFVNQNLMRRFGLPVIPLSCLFIRSSVQTYHMFLATHIPPPIPLASTATALALESPTPITTAALEHFDTIIRKALGRSAFGIPDPTATARWFLPSADDAIAALTMLVFFLGAFFVLLACKLVLGMLLLKFARNRYSSMKDREHKSYETGGKRVGGWGTVEVDDTKKRRIYDDDLETLNKLKEKERAAKEKAENGSAGGHDFSKISRYEMSAKRIW